MNRLILAAAMLLPMFASGPAWAQEAVEIDADACRYAQQYQPSDDVEYKPGVDVDGNAVAPADLAGGPQIEPPTHFVIPVTVDLGRRLRGAPYNTTPGAFVGLITVDNGALSFNGQPLGEGAEGSVAAACRAKKAAGKAEKAAD